MQQEESLSDSIENQLLISTLRGQEINVTINQYESSKGEHRNILAPLENKKLKLKGNTRIHQLYKILEDILNGTRIVLFCEKIIPSPDDCLGDLMSILQKSELGFKVALETVGG